MRKSFFGRTETAVTALLSAGEDLDGALQEIRRSVEIGADGIAMQLQNMPMELRTKENYRKMMDQAPDLPFMFIDYRSDKFLGNNDEARQKFLMEAAEVGAEVIDVMGDLFDPEPYELAVKPEAIAKQKKLIEQIHASGAKVIMSSHMTVPRTAGQVLAHLQEQSSRGADILKIVIKIDTEAEFLEAVHTLFVLKQNLTKPYVFLAGGKYGRLLRFLGIKLGVAISFANMTDGGVIPALCDLRAGMDAIHFSAE